MFSIGDLSMQTGVKIPTIRYYEQQGLIEAAGRSSGNQRRYDQNGLERLAFIKHGRDLGLTLDAIRELIDLSTDSNRSCVDADNIARTHLISIRDRIARLKRLEAELVRITSVKHEDCIGSCYVIHALSDHTLCADDHDGRSARL